MFSDPNMAEWFSGLLLMVVAMGVLIGVSALIAWTGIRVLGDERMQTQEDETSFGSTPMQEKKRTAA